MVGVGVLFAWRRLAALVLVFRLPLGEFIVGIIRQPEKLGIRVLRDMACFAVFGIFRLHLAGLNPPSLVPRG